MTKEKREAICFLIGAGETDDYWQKIYPDDYVIACDGGYCHCQKHQIVPDCLLGDFDSLGYHPQFPHVIALKPEKDNTDMAAAVEEGIRQGYRKFVIYGGSGGRISHTIANIQLMAKMAKDGLQVEMHGMKTSYFILHDREMTFPPNSKGYLSVFSLSDDSVGVEEENLKYELIDARLTNCEALGVSNEFMGKEARVAVRQGTLLLIWEK